MSEPELETKQQKLVNPSMYYRLNRSKRIKRKNKGLPYFGISVMMVMFIVVIIIGSNPTLKQAANDAADLLDVEEEGPYKSDITFTTIDGKTIKLADHQGEVIIVFFFGTHCPGCPDQADILEDIDDDYYSSELFIVPICLDSVAETPNSELRDFLDARQTSWPAIRDTPQYTYATYFKIQYKPTVKILDKDGNVEETMVGTTQGSYDNIKEEVDSLL